MSIKSKLILGTATAILGLSLVGAPTYAYFFHSENLDKISEENKIDLNTSTYTIIQVDQLKPGDKMTRSFKLSNDGNTNIKNVLLDTTYTIEDANHNNIEDFGKHIRVNFMWNEDKALSRKWSPDNIIYKTTLYDLQKMTPDAVNNKLFIPYFEERGGIEAGDTDKLFVQFEFVDNNQKQNEFQGDKLELTWTFEGIAE
ncbi:TasA family protein [Virgibacillus halodenitrificans]|uniref:TasA family protein n=1 Tax=Virgibacillus halodenitrificans TaxID=1482 RepID=UPI002DBDD4D8|nr:TasA family protein [Virgibacillus halodenitrificans]MEC2159636.1 TasA family protein [Virgibacillus halodenitrificans]